MSYGEFLKSIYSPYWWLTAFALAIVANLLSAWLKPPLDKALSAVSTTWRHRQLAQSELMRRRATYLIEDDIRLLLFAHHTTRVFLGVVALGVLVTWALASAGAIPADPVRKWIMYALRVSLIVLVLWALNRYEFEKKTIFRAIEERERRKHSFSSSDT